ncbi:MAG TPA: TRAP transporter small permease [Rhodocyclaceae bacterium]|nr:TRAP transporter small permease [Rhodocyclaceae bacterium]
MQELDFVGEPHTVVEHDAMEHWLVILAKGFALAGGALFIALVAMSLYSIIARKLGFTPVNGDMELMQMGTAVAAAAFMPYCTIMGDHLKVEFFTEGARPAVRGLLDTVGNLLIAVVFAVIAWRTGLQMLDTKDSGETSTLLSFPIWIPMLAILPSLIVAALCALHLAWDDLIDVIRGDAK